MKTKKYLAFIGFGLFSIMVNTVYAESLSEAACQSAKNCQEIVNLKDTTDPLIAYKYSGYSTAYLITCTNRYQYNIFNSNNGVYNISNNTDNNSPYNSACLKMFNDSIKLADLIKKLCINAPNNC